MTFQRKETVGYDGMHARLRTGRTGVCYTCGATGRTQMALLPDRGELICPRRGCRYSLDPNDYRELCGDCHAADRGPASYSEATRAAYENDPTYRGRVSAALTGKPRPDISAMFKGKRSESSRRGWETRRRRTCASATRN